MTSRAEYRLILRQDNADLRLTPLGYEVGLISRARYDRVEKKRTQIAAELARLEQINLSPLNGSAEILIDHGLPPLDDGVNAKKFLRRPEVNYDVIAQLTPPPQSLPADVIEQVTIETKFEGYLAKQQQQIERLKRLESMPIPADFDLETVPGLRKEARQKLIRFRPATLGQASRIAGVNPADVSILLIYLERQNASKRQQAEQQASPPG
jgi:tRNA uridine 5-carboxymethylaminomethyl modification enzyme